MSATYSLNAEALQVLERNRTRNISARTTKDLQHNDPMDTCGLLREDSRGWVSLETMKLPDRDSVPGVADVSRIASWLNYIGEQDPITVAEVFEKCREDPEHRELSFEEKSAVEGAGGITLAEWERYFWITEASKFPNRRFCLQHDDRTRIRVSSWHPSTLAKGAGTALVGRGVLHPRRIADGVTAGVEDLLAEGASVATMGPNPMAVRCASFVSCHQKSTSRM